MSTDAWGSETTKDAEGKSNGNLENQDGEIQDEEGVEAVEVEVEVQDGKSQDEEEVEKVEVPASQPRGDEEDEEEQKPPVDQTHHILDEFQKKILLRAEQDTAMGVAGKGRKKKDKAEKEAEQVPKRKGKRGDAKDVPSATSAAPKKRTRKPKVSDGETAPKKPRTAKTSGKKDPVARRLFHDESPEKSEKTSPPTKPNPKKKASPKKKAPPKKTEKAKTGDKEEKKVKIGKVKEEKAEKGSKAARVPREKKPKVPSFSCSHVVPYWSRDAVALKVPGGGGKTGLTQAGLNTS